jgi:EAL domain-containing protein (putative c-di-GMP-specific phosphodiesterase class I)
LVACNDRIGRSMFGVFSDLAGAQDWALVILGAGACLAACAGVRIAMDDFGTGYSSLSYLQVFPFDKIKIDQAFISNLESNPQSATIVRAVIGLARGLNVPVLAEGVETKEQLAFLAKEQCDEVQGYLIGRPLPIADYAEMTGAPISLSARKARAALG